MQSQPYRKGINRAPSAALTAMTRGKAADGTHPMDAQRAAMKTLQRVAKSRPDRPARPDRPKRPAR